jgi:HD-GYP domain-containing protein (c-di-GMP phosphodiesterase class II)
MGMKIIETARLVPGTITQHELYDSQGVLLVAAGTELTQRHIDTLLRRRINEVYYSEEGTDRFVDKLLSSDLSELSDLDLGDLPAKSPLTIPGLSITDLKKVQAGNDGLRQLLSARRTSDLDRRIDRGFPADRPVGTPFFTHMTQLGVADRTAEYKHTISQAYEQSLGGVRTMLTALITGEQVDAVQIRSIVARFLKTMLTDKNIVLNLTAFKQASGEYLWNHALNVSLLAINIAAFLGYSEKQIAEIGMAGMLHDIGMLLVPEGIRLKPDRLTADEWFEIQKHPILGLHVLEKVDRLPETVAIAAYQSHERENGTGYPRQRGGRLIHQYAKIVQCADVFDAASSPRAYRPANAPYKSMELLVKMANQGFVPSDFVKSLLSYTSLFPIGSLVMLSDNSLAKVVAANGRAFTKPVVSVLTDSTGQYLSPAAIYQVDLHDTPDLMILKSFPWGAYPDVGVMDGF